MASSELWIPLMEYAIKKGVSLSTLRRHIKSNKIEHRSENGRYLLRDDGAPDAIVSESSAPAQGSLPEPPIQSRVADLGPSVPLVEFLSVRRELEAAREEIAELKTLIAFYEEKLLPPAPPAGGRPNPYSQRNV